MRRGVLAALAAALALAGPAHAGDSARGRQLFLEGCASCHGLDARGIANRAPSLHGVGALAADFYLSTGRMPLDEPNAEPSRNVPAYPRQQIDDLVSYVASLGGSPVPAVPQGGSLAEGMRAFTDHCAGCHQIAARGGAIVGGWSPGLQDATPQQIVEAVRLGPYLMPVFDEKLLPDRELASIIQYVRSTRHTQDFGGWGLFDIGPVPEGMVTWLLGVAALLVVIRLLGERVKR